MELAWQTPSLWFKSDNCTYNKPALITHFTKKKVYWIIHNCTWSVLTQFATYFGVKLRGCERQAGSGFVIVLKTEFAATGSAAAPWSGLQFQQLKLSTFRQKGLKELLFSLVRTHFHTEASTKVKCRQWIYSLENWLNWYRRKSPNDSDHSQRRFTSIWAKTGLQAH